MVFLDNIHWVTKAVNWDFVVRPELVVAFCEVSVCEENVGAVEDRLGQLEIERFCSDCRGPQRVPDFLTAIEGRRSLPELIAFASQLALSQRDV